MKLFAFFAAITLSVAAAPTLAQNSAQDGARQSATSASDMTDGEVRRVDKARGAVLLKHGEIKNLNMGAMTMVFKLQDPTMVDQLQAGDKVKFSAVQKGEDLIVTSIRKAQ